MGFPGCRSLWVLLVTCFGPPQANVGVVISTPLHYFLDRHDPACIVLIGASGPSFDSWGKGKSGVTRPVTLFRFRASLDRMVCEWNRPSTRSGLRRLRNGQDGKLSGSDASVVADSFDK